MGKTEYENLRLDVLEKMINSRGIECKSKKEEMIKMLKLDDEGKYKPPLKETTYEKSENGFVVSIDVRNQQHLTQIGKLTEKKEAKNLNRYSLGCVFYWSKTKLI